MKRQRNDLTPKPENRPTIKSMFEMMINTIISPTLKPNINKNNNQTNEKMTKPMSDMTQNMEIGLVLRLMDMTFMNSTTKSPTQCPMFMEYKEEEVRGRRLYQNPTSLLYNFSCCHHLLCLVMETRENLLSRYLLTLEMVVEVLLISTHWKGRYFQWERRRKERNLGKL